MADGGRPLHRDVWAIVPIKEIVFAKQRLAKALSPARRQELAVAMFEDVMQALSASRGLAGIVRLPGRRGDAARFDPNTSAHHHAVCDGCGTVLDIAAGTLEPTPGGTRLKLVQQVFENSEVRNLHNGGWSSSFNKLQKIAA